MPRLKPPFFPAVKGLYMQPTIVNNVETLSNLPWIVAQRRRRLRRPGHRGVQRHPPVRRLRPRAAARHLRGRAGRHHVPRPDLCPRRTAAASATATSSRRSSPAAARPRGSSRSSSTCRSTPARSAMPARCSARAPSSSWTRPPARCGRPGASCASSPGSRAASARPAARAAAGWPRSCAASRRRRSRGGPRPAARRGRQHQPRALPRRPWRRGGRALPAPQTTICPLGPVGGVAHRLVHPPLPRRVPRPTSRTGGARCRREPTSPAEGHASPFTLDGQDLEARPGELVIAAAERSGTYIPRFCYHPRMTPVGMCRMCLVEIDTGRGPAPARLHDPGGRRA